MSNVRHVSIFNESKNISFQSGANFSFSQIKNIGIIYLNPSKKYKIKNLSVDIGSVINTLKDVYFANTREFGFPFRFYLDDDPLVNAVKSLELAYPTGSVFVNNSTPVDKNNIPPSAIDVVDSSNINFYLNQFYNSIGINVVNGNPELFTQTIKTQTIAEYNFYNFSYSRIEESTSKFINVISSNNEIANFDFESKSFKYLCFSIFPYYRFFVQSSSYVFNLLFNYTVNFDLIEED